MKKAKKVFYIEPDVLKEAILECKRLGRLTERYCLLCNKLVERLYSRVISVKYGKDSVYKEDDISTVALHCYTCYDKIDDKQTGNKMFGYLSMTATNKFIDIYRQKKKDLVSMEDVTSFIGGYNFSDIFS